MSQPNTLHPPCQIGILPLDAVVSMGTVDDVCQLTASLPIWRPDVTPASVTIQDTPKDGVWNKKHTFYITDTPAVRWQLSIFHSLHVIFLYTDWRGTQRVSGNARHPLALAFQPREGRLEVTLTGTADAPDPQLA